MTREQRLGQQLLDTITIIMSPPPATLTPEEALESAAIDYLGTHGAHECPALVVATAEIHEVSALELGRAIRAAQAQELGRA